MFGSDFGHRIVIMNAQTGALNNLVKLDQLLLRRFIGPKLRLSQHEYVSVGRGFIKIVFSWDYFLENKRFVTVLCADIIRLFCALNVG